MFDSESSSLVDDSECSAAGYHDRASPKIRYTAAHIGKVPHFVRQHNAPNPSLLLKVTRFGRDIPTRQGTTINDDSPDGQLKSPTIDKLMNTYLKMKSGGGEGNNYASNLRDKLTHSESLARLLRGRASDVTKFSLVNNLPPKLIPQRVTPYRVSKYTVRDYKKPLSLRVVPNMNDSISNQPSLHSPITLYEFGAITEESQTSVHNKCSSCCELMIDEKASPRMQASATIRQLALLSSSSEHTRVPDLKCRLCPLKALTWCPKCHEAYCFSCWNLVRHNRAGSDDLLLSHYRALMLTDFTKLEGNTSSADSTLASRRVKSRGEVRRGRWSSAQMTAVDAVDILEPLVATSLDKFIKDHSRWCPSKREGSFTDEWNDVVHDTVEGLIETMGLSISLSTEIKPPEPADSVLLLNGQKAAPLREFIAHMPFASLSHDSSPHQQVDIVKGKIVRVRKS